MRITISAIKADVGSPGGHTKPGEEMLKFYRDNVESAIKISRE